MYTNADLNGQIITFKIYTEAAVTVIPTKEYEPSSDGGLQRSHKIFRGANNTELEVCDQFKGTLENGGKIYHNLCGTRVNSSLTGISSNTRTKLNKETGLI